MRSIYELSPREFEELSVEYLRSKGFSDVRRVGQAGDLGVDIRCQDPQGRLVVAQCKRYRMDRTIGSPSIQHFFGMVVHAGAARSIFITTSDYTQPARNLARERDIELVDGSDIDAFYREKLGIPHQVEQDVPSDKVTDQGQSNPLRSTWSVISSKLKTKANPSPVSRTPVEKALPQEARGQAKRREVELDQSLYSRKFCFEHVEGDLLFPVRVRDQKTGRLKFQVWDKSKSEAFGVEEDKMVDLVLKSNYAVRMKCPETGRNGGYRRNGHSIRAVRRLTK